MGWFDGLWNSVKDAGRKFAGIVGEGLGNAASKVGSWVDSAAEKVASVPILGDIAKYAVDRTGIGSLYKDAMDLAGGGADALKSVANGGSFSDAWNSVRDKAGKLRDRVTSFPSAQARVRATTLVYDKHTPPTLEETRAKLNQKTAEQLDTLYGSGGKRFYQR